MKNLDIRRRLLELAMVVLGNLIYAVTVVLFILPARLMSCGTTGIALVLERLWNIPISGFVLAFNILMLLLGWLVLGRAFAMTTVLSSLLYPVLLEVCRQVLGDSGITENMLLNTVFGGLGLGLAMGAPVYVCAKDMQANTVTVGPEKSLFDRIVYAEEVNWIAIPALTAPLRVTARTRYHQVEQAATVYPAGEDRFRLEFDEPQRAPTPGQAVVLYQGDVVLGGGTIVRVEK